MAIKRAKTLDDIPESNPRRYTAGNGYRILRWKVRKGEYVEALEHRYLMGLPPEHLQVHHINHDKTDNRIENLRVMTRAEHAKHHAEHNSCDEQSVVRLYLSGMSQPAIGRELGINAATVSRVLKRMGVPARSNAEHYEFAVDREEILTRVFNGEPVAAVARDTGVAEGTARRMARQAGWVGKSGRPSKPR